MSLVARRGDAPGYIDQARKRLAGLGTPVRSSDLYRMASGSADGESEYTLVTRLETPLSEDRFDAALRQIEQRYGAEHIRLARVDAGAALPALLALGEIVEGDRAAETRRVEELPAGRGRVNRRIPQRIRGTAEPQAQAPLDYDAPCGAATDYDDVRPLTPFSEAVLQRVLAVLDLRPDMRVLDIGCGTGRFTRLVAERAAWVTGVDKSANMLAAAQRHGHGPKRNITYVRADANSALADGEFEAATFFFSIHYLSLEPAFWNRLRRRLRHDGRVAIATFPHRHFIENELTEYFPSIPSVDLARFPSVPGLCENLAGNGFGDISVSELVRRDRVASATFIAQVERKYLSSFHLLEPAEFAAGVRALKSALAGDAHIERVVRGVVVAASCAGQGQTEERGENQGSGE